MNAASELPLGEDVWGDTRVALGDIELAGTTELFSARSPTVEGSGRERFLNVATVLAEFPVAVIRGSTFDPAPASE